MANAGTAALEIVVKFNSLTIGELVGVSHDGFSTSVLDISSSADTANWKDFLQGKKDAGTLELKVRAHSVSINSGDASPLYWIGLGRKTLECVFPMGSGQTVAPKFSVAAICVKDTGPSGTIEDPAERTITFKLCSQPTFTAGS